MMETKEILPLIIPSFKIYISYFYQIRFFTPNMLPLSTAIYPPEWYQKVGYGNYFVDKNGVVNGLNIDEFIFPKSIYDNEIWDEDKCGPNCKYGGDMIGKEPSEWCSFMKKYYEYLKKRDLINIINKYTYHAERVFNAMFNKNIDTLVLIVHEPPTKACSERLVLQRYFADYGIELKEWNPNERA